MKCDVKILLYTLYIVGLFVACIENNWLFCVLFSLVGLLCIFKYKYNIYIIYIFIVYLIAYNKLNILYIPFMLGIYVTTHYTNGIKLGKEQLPHVLTLTILVFFQTHFWYAIIPLYIFYLAKKYDPRLFIGCAIILLLAAANFLIISNIKNANTIAIYSYYFLVLGVLGELIYEIIHQNTGSTIDQNTENN